MKTTAIIQCNHIGWEGSLDVSLREDPQGQKVIEMVMRRAKELSETDLVPILACPDVPENQIFAQLARQHGCDIFFGSNNDVLDRLIKACQLRGGDRIAWLQGIHYFLHPALMDRLLRWAEKGNMDYVRCVDASCKFMLGQSIRMEALERALSLVAELDLKQAAFFRARPFAFMRTHPQKFSVGLFEELPCYQETELRNMREIARTIYIEERAIHTERAQEIGDISQGRYTSIQHLIPQTGKIVDVACGTGYGCRIIDNGLRRLIGVDISKEAIFFAEKYNGTHAEFLLGDAECIPVEDNSAACVVSIATIEHVTDDKLFIREIYRILEPGGLAIIYTPQNRLDHRPLWPWHNREYDIDGISNLVRNMLLLERIIGWQNGIITEDDPRGDGMYVVARKSR